MVDQLHPTTGRSSPGPPMPRVNGTGPLTPPPLMLDDVLGPPDASDTRRGRGADEPDAPRSLGHRAFWTFFDQGISSLTNVVLTLIVAKTAGVTGLGFFALGFAAFSFVIGISRAMVSDPLMIRFSAAGPAEQRRASRQAAGAAAVLGTAAGVLCAAIGAVLERLGTPLGTGLAPVLFALAVVLPGLMVQDAWRFAFFVAGRPAAATLNDAVWAVAQFGLIGALIVSGNTSVELLTLAWGAAAGFAALVGCLQLRTVPAITAGPAWFRTHRELSVRMGADYVVNMASVNIATYGIAGVIGGAAGVAAAGALKSAQTLLGPLQLAFAGLSAFVLPVFARRVAARQSLTKPIMLVALGLGTIASVGTAILVLIPDSLGELILSPATWPGAHSVMLGSGIAVTAVALAVGPALGLKAYGRADLGLRVTFVQAPLVVALGFLGAMWNGAPGAAIGLAIPQIIGMLVCWVFFRLAQREAARGGAPVFARHARAYDRFAWAVAPATPRHGPTVRGVVVPTRSAPAAGRHALRRDPRPRNRG